jgi:tetratricopeptide (TPR) repeat protein
MVNPFQTMQIHKRIWSTQGGPMRNESHRVFWIALILLAGVVVTSSVGAASTESSNKYAIIVGINEYESQNVPRLYCAVNDARAVGNYLIKKMGFDENRVFLFTSDGKAQPNRGNIAGAMGKIIDNIKPGGTFIFFFSGHGMNREGESFLLTREANPENRLSLEETALKISRLRTYMQEMKADKVLIMIDACRTEIGAKKGSGKNTMSPDFAKSLVIKAAGDEKEGSGGIKVSATLFSCSNGESSYEWSEKENGFFTHYLLRGLDGEAADASGMVTLNGLESYLSQKVNDAVKVQRGESQTPWMERSGSNPGAWALVGKGRETATTGGKIPIQPTPSNKQQPPPTRDGTQETDALLAHADALIDNNECDKAIAECSRAIATNPGSPELYSKRARAYNSKGDYEDSLKDITKAFSLGSHLAETHNLRGIVLLRHKKDTGLALADFNKAIQLDPGYYKAYMNRGDCQKNKGSYGEALKDYNEALAIKQDYYPAYCRRGALYRDQKDYDRAIADYTRAISLKPDYAESYYGRGLVYLDKKDGDKAIEDYTRAISLKPDHAFAYNDRGIAYRTLKDGDKAIADYTNAIRIKPDYPNAYINRGNIYLDRKDYDKAIADYTRAIRFKPDFAMAYYNRARSFCALKNYQNAKSDLQKCIQSAPSSEKSLIENAKKILADIDKK